MERMESDRIAKRVYVENCAVNHLRSWSWKSWIDNVKDCLTKRFGCQQARRMVNAGVL